MSWLVESEVPCPWCGEYFTTMVDTAQGSYETIEDCAVCCRPITMSVEVEPGEVLSLEAGRG